MAHGTSADVCTAAGDASAGLVAPDGRPARRPSDARCPRCGAGADQRVRSGMGALQDVTCAMCAFEFPKETAS